MEVVGGVSSVIAIVDLTAKIAKICAQYINGVKNAPEEIKIFKEKIEHLQKLLEDLDKLLKGPDSNRFTSSKKLRDTLKDCRNDLENLTSRLEIPGTSATVAPVVQSSSSSAQPPRKGLGRIIKKFEKAINMKEKMTPELVQVLRWPLTKPEVEAILSRLSGMQEVLNTAILIDQSTTLSEIIRKTDNLNLPVAPGAHYSWYDPKDEYEPLCLPNTREDILGKIKDWAIDPSSKHMFWLSGPAGSGKSTVARTVSHNFQHENEKGGDWSRLPHSPFLGGSFFFRRGEESRSNCSRFFTSLAVSLAQPHHDQYVPGLSASISKAIDEAPNISIRALNEQFKSLIQQPIKSIKPLKRILLVIDAIDECENENEVKVIIYLLWQLKDIPDQPIRVLFTGRPENFVDESFENSKLDGFYRKELLHEIPEGNIQNDIYVYVQNEFNKIKEKHEREGTLPVDWPDDADVERLVQMAVPLFIVAATICRYVGDKGVSPERQLAKIMSQRTLISKRGSLRATYKQVLEGRLDDKSDEDKAEFLADFRDIIGTIVLKFSPDGSLFVSGGDDEGSKLWDARTWDLLQVFGVGFAASADFSPDGEYLVCTELENRGGEHKYDPQHPTISMHRLKSQRMEHIWSSNKDAHAQPSMVPSDTAFVSKDLLVIIDGPRVILWNLGSMVWWVIDQESEDNDFIGVAISLDRRFLAYLGSMDRTVVKIWDLAILERSSPSSGEAGSFYERVSWVELSVDCRLLAAGSYDEDDWIGLWRLTTDGLVFIHELKGHRGKSGTACGGFSPDGKLLASTSQSSRYPEVIIWDTMSGEVLLKYEDSSDISWNKVNSSPDGTLFALIAEYPHRITIFNIKAIPKFVTEFVPSVKRLTFANFSVDGIFLILAGLNKFRTSDDSWVVELRSTENWELIKMITKGSEDELFSELEQGIEIDGRRISIVPSNISEGAVWIDPIFQFCSRDIKGWRNCKLPDMNFEYERRRKDIPAWIHQDGERVLWIPHEFRPGGHYDSSGAEVSIRGNTIAFGHGKYTNAMKLGHIN
ncbi:hypothetical protein AA313_de0209161 [Arthrobotrys entomopaga]|nr:hypothetical protein AA313_de0209161 [Arthrobotrys entomopaga]